MYRSGIYIGVNSGTSADGVDAALCRIQGWQGRPSFLATLHRPYPEAVDELYQRVLTGGALDAEEWLRLDRGIALTAGKAVVDLLEETMLRPEEVEAVGWHGQTVFHLPESNPSDRMGITGSLQLGNGCWMAQRIRIPVVTDFRASDMAQGGRGAPLTPILDLAFYGHHVKPVITLNLGGIANISRIGRQVPVRAMDVGPANSILDSLARRFFDRAYDPEGYFALQGKINGPLLERMQAHPYLSRTGPRATGREVFGPAWLSSLIQEFPRVESADWMATAVEFTVYCISHTLRMEGLLDPAPARIVVSGGGVCNRTLMKRLEEAMAPIRVVTSDSQGIPYQARESLLFAHLAWRHMSSLPGNLPAVTGAKEAVVLGCFCPVTNAG